MVGDTLMNKKTALKIVTTLLALCTLWCSSGLIAFSLPVFIIVSLISRSLRFFIVAYLSYKFGELFTEYMNKYGSKWFTIIGIIIVIIFIFIYFFFKLNV